MRITGIPYVQGRNAYKDPDGTKYGIAIHNTSNTGSAKAEASYATRRTDGVSSHLYADRSDVIQSLDTVSKAGHAGSSEGNNNGVAVEITGTNGKTRQWWIDNVNWPLLGRSLAQVVRAYGIAVRRASVDEMKRNPRVRAFYSHNDMRQAWGGTTHDDPGPNFPWDYLFSAVNAALGGGGGSTKPPTTSTGKDDDEMGFIAVNVPTGDTYYCAGGASYWLPTSTAVNDKVYLASQGAFPLVLHKPTTDAERVEWTTEGYRKGWNEAAFGPIVGPRPPSEQPKG